MKVKQLFKRNGSTILTCVGAVGVVATAVTAVRTTPKVVKLLDASEAEKGKKLSKSEVVQIAWPHYIPTLLIGASTIACIFGANVMNKRQQAALMSAYAILDSSYKEYKNEVIEIYGEEADENVRSEIAKDRYEEEDISLEEDDGKKLFYDEFSQRYYRASTETVLRAEYEINKELNEHGAAYLNDYYDLLNIDRVDYGDHLGWSSAQMYEMYWDSWLHFHKTKVVMDDGMECWIISFSDPFVDFTEY